MMSAASRLADQVITVSEFSRQEIGRYLKLARETVDVVYPGVDPGFQRASEDRVREVRSHYGITGDYILYTGIFKPRKNHAALLHAFRHFADSEGSAQLVIAGPVNESTNDLQCLANDLGIAHRVLFTGFINEADLPALYSGARVYACPSLYEGFGFTVLEAMACGVPVVCSPMTSLPEVAGDAALYADPKSTPEFARALSRAFTEVPLRTTLMERGLRNVNRFQWKSTAAKILELYDSVMSQRVAGAVFA
jgi:alpha-1,3-rhamnosyl/mannosyltransferase